MIDRLLGFVIVAFWAVMMILLVLRDLVPQWTASQPPSYQTLLRHKLQPERYRMGVFWGDRLLGTSATTIEPELDGSYSLENDTALNTPFPGLEDLTIVSRTRIGKDYELREFTTTLASGDLTGKLFGQVDGNRLHMEFRLGDNKMERDVPYVPGGTFSNGLSPFVQMPELSVGKEWTICAVNPMTGQVETGTARVIELEHIEWQGQTVDAWRVALAQGQQEATSWIDREGRILREEIQFMSSRLVLIREKSE